MYYLLDQLHAKEDLRRKEIPLGGDFRPKPEVPVIVAAGMGLRFVLSRDDGKTWKEVFFGFPAHDHSAFATFDIGYTNGVFAASSAWGSRARGTVIASEDGVYWRHLTGPKRKGRWDAQGMGVSLTLSKPPSLDGAVAWLRRTGYQATLVW